MNPPIGQRIRTVRLARQMSQAQLGASAGFHGNTIKDIEKGYQWCDMIRLGLLCAALGVTVKAIRSKDWRRLCSDGRISLEPPM